jgi:hypothetical protein
MKKIFLIAINLIYINSNSQGFDFTDLNEKTVISFLSKDGYILRDAKKTPNGYSFYSSYQKNSSELITSLIEQEIIFLNGYPISFELNWKNIYYIQKDKSVVDDLDLNKITNDLFRKNLTSQFNEYKNKVINVLELSTNNEYKTKIENNNNINSFKAGEIKENDDFIYVKNTIDSKLDVKELPFLVGVQGDNSEKIRFFDVSTYNIEEMIKLFIKDLKYHINEYQFNNIEKVDPKKIKDLNTILDNINIKSTFEEMDNQTLAVSYGINNENNVIVKVNPLNWVESSNQKKWYIIYHELGHDILNFQHGEGDVMMFNFIDKKYTWSEFFNDRKKMFDVYFSKKLIKKNDIKVVSLNTTNKFKIIPTIKIGNQLWTKNNLNVNKYRNGDLIPEVKDPKEWYKLTTGAWCYYNNDPKNGAIYGKLYNWYAVNDPRGLAPEGFHIPTVTELNVLQTTKINKIFRGLPGGWRAPSGEFKCIGECIEWWSSIEYDFQAAWSRDIFDYFLENKPSNYISKTNGFNVRCIKD